MGDELDEMNELVSRQEEEDYFDSRRDRAGCLFPGNCHMPGLHNESECRSLDEVAEIYDEMDCRDYPV